MIKLREHLYVGNIRDVTTEQDLMDKGITAILNVAYEVNDKPMNPRIVKTTKIGLTDSPDNTEEMKKLAVETAKQLLDAGETLLVHCSAGLSRSVYVCDMVISEREGKDWHDVFYEIQKKHPFALVGPLFHGANAKYYRDLEDIERKENKS